MENRWLHHRVCAAGRTHGRRDFVFLIFLLVEFWSGSSRWRQRQTSPYVQFPDVSLFCDFLRGFRERATRILGDNPQQEFHGCPDGGGDYRHCSGSRGPPQSCAVALGVRTRHIWLLDVFLPRRE